MGGNNTITEICKELSSAGASHVDTFQEWVTDFSDSAGKNAKLKDSWSDPEKMHTDTGKCMDGWEKNHDYSCLLYTSDAADEEDSVGLGGHRLIKKKK